jgi:hypothetical protein
MTAPDEAAGTTDRAAHARMRRRGTDMIEHGRNTPG